MASTIIIYEGDGSKVDFNIPFDYLKKKFVTVSLGPTRLTGGDYGDTGADYYFLDKTTIRLKTPPAVGVSLTIRRYTSATERVVTFKDASILKATDLDTSQVQAFHIAEEGRDIINDALIVDREGNWDAKGKRIVNVGDPVGDSDAVTYGVYKTDALGALQSKVAAEAARDRAVEAETNSKKSEENAKLSEVNAQASAGTAVSASKHADAVMVENQAILQEATELRNENKVLNANTQENAVVATTKAAEAKISEANAKMSEVNSKESEDNAKASEDSASASAELAKNWATKLGATVDGTEYSAKYYANKANEILTQGATEAVNRVASEGDKQVALVTSTGATQVSRVNTEGTTQVNLAKAQVAAATQKANEASDSAAAAASSAGDAAVSANDASASQAQATKDANTARANSTAASVFATKAGQYADAASASASSAEASATEATSQANTAKAQATEATKQADRAKDYADQASSGQIQADWAETVTTSKAFIKNKPALGALASKDSVAYSEITGTPPQPDLTPYAKKAEVTQDLAGKADKTYVDTELAKKQPKGNYQPAGDYATTTALTEGLAGKANKVHTHAVGDVTGLQSALDGKQAKGDYATTTALTEGLAGKANKVHTHTKSQIIDFPTIPDTSTLIPKTGNRGAIGGYEGWMEISGPVATISNSSGDSILIHGNNSAVTINITSGAWNQVATKIVWIDASNGSVSFNNLTGWFSKQAPTIKKHAALVLFFHDLGSEASLLGTWD